jgi:GT2 family glycosyltransferase
MGVASSRNFGARECGGDLICAVDNDACFADSESLVRVVELFRSDARLGVLSFCILREDTEEIDPFTWVYRRSQRKWAKKEFKTFTFTGGGFCVRAKAFWEVGGFWDHLEFSREEEDLAFGLINRGWEVVYTPEIVIRHYPENRRSHKIAERRVNEFRNGILILWRRLPIPFSLFAVCLRVCTMSVKAFLREKRFPTTLLYVLPEVIREWNKSGLKRTPIRFASVWRYVVLHMRS